MILTVYLYVAYNAIAIATDSLKATDNLNSH